jgi:toxin ParE1/3/4
MRLEITQLARSDIFFIQQQGFSRSGRLQTRKYLDDLIEQLKLLARFPGMARERTEFRKPVRIQPFRGHIIVYRIDSEAVRILRVLSRRQDWAEYV